MEYINALRAGTRLEEYQVREVLGQGGFGITYLADDTKLDRVVALKEYLPRDFAARTAGSTVVPNSSADAADYRWGLERFLDEARTLARFDHPHLNKVHRFFEANGTAYLVLEYIDGQTLSLLLTKYPTLPATHLQRIIREVLSGLVEVHQAGYIHRDIKPSNIMLRSDGSAVLLDFGAARQAVGQRSKSITSILTPGYAPLEQYDTKAEDVGPWSDLYALGMVAYRCVSGLRDADLPDAVTRSRNQRKGVPDLAPAAGAGSRTAAGSRGRAAGPGGGSAGGSGTATAGAGSRSAGGSRTATANVRGTVGGRRVLEGTVRPARMLRLHAQLSSGQKRDMDWRVFRRSGPRNGDTDIYREWLQKRIHRTYPGRQAVRPLGHTQREGRCLGRAVCERQDAWPLDRAPGERKSLGRVVCRWRATGLMIARPDFRIIAIMLPVPQ